MIFKKLKLLSIYGSNIHLISSGMGKNDGSNYLVIEVNNRDSIELNWMAINAEDGAA